MNWQKIWNNRNRFNKIILEAMIKLDGFDNKNSYMNIDEWLTYCNFFYDKLEILDYSVYEIGCGSGAFLFPLYLKGNKVGGLDYSEFLIKFAQFIMPKGDFINNEAKNIDIKKKYDIVVSHSVFYYLTDYGYAKIVLKKMINKAKIKIGIFDINDIEKKEGYIDYRLKCMDISLKEYKNKYRNLPHLFYSKEWFEKIAKENGLKIKIFTKEFPFYKNSKFRFHVVMEK